MNKHLIIEHKLNTPNKLSYRLFLVLFFIVISSFSKLVLAQSGCYTIVDSLSGKEIPYCNVLIDSNIGLVTNNEGRFCVPNNLKVSGILIQVSNIAYHGKQITYKSTHNDSIIYLIPHEHGLPEVNINWSKYKFSWFGFKKKNPDYYFNLWRFCHTGLVFPPTKQQGAVFEEVKVFIQNNNQNKVPFRLHIYAVDSLGGVGKELLPENVFGKLETESKKALVINVLKYQIVVPQKGYIVTIELLSNRKADKLVLSHEKYYEVNNNEIGFVNAEYKFRKYKKVSAWKPNSFYVEEYPYTNASNVLAGLPLIKVKIREIKE